MYTAIRIEHTDGGGMFLSYNGDEIRPHSAQIILPDLVSRHRDFETPWEEPVSFCKLDFCAYKSIQQLNQWVTSEEISELIDNNYTIYELSLSECQIGNDQVVFKKEHILEKKSLNHLFKN